VGRESKKIYSVAKKGRLVREKGAVKDFQLAGKKRSFGRLGKTAEKERAPFAAGASDASTEGGK